jgi:hypothetical protein
MGHTHACTGPTVPPATPESPNLVQFFRVSCTQDRGFVSVTSETRGIQDGNSGLATVSHTIAGSDE